MYFSSLFSLILDISPFGCWIVKMILSHVCNRGQNSSTCTTISLRVDLRNYYYSLICFVVIWSRNRETADKPMSSFQYGEFYSTIFFMLYVVNTLMILKNKLALQVLNRQRFGDG